MNQFSDRRYFISGIIVLFTIFIIFRLFYLQLIDSSYKEFAYSNAQRHVTQYPARGLVFDRNHRLLVSNKAAYDLMISPLELRKFDTLLLCKFLKISKEQVIQTIIDARRYSKYKPSIFLKQLSSDDYAFLQEKLYQFPGFFVQPRTIREYTMNIGAHVLGYVGEVDSNIIRKKPYYKIGDYIGISGIENSYEEELKGEKGVKIYLVDVHNRIKGSFMDGGYDKSAKVGRDLTVTLDAELQAYGERLMQNKIGSIVAIEPQTGEILALISSPTYDPNMLVGRDRRSNFRQFDTSSLKPLFNRALMAKYPPGSTFKTINCMIALKRNLINRYTRFYCYNGFRAGPIFVGCHDHETPLDLVGSIQCSCNAYYCNVLKAILTDYHFKSTADAYNDWREYVLSFGFGKKLGCDFANELNGFIPSKDYYNKIYGVNSWSYLTVISLAIGQGELGITPIQMANMTSTIANRGYYYIPHVVKIIKDKKTIDEKYTEKHYTLIDSSIFEQVIEGMYMAVNGQAGSGSTARIAAIKNIDVCGKTGTAENPHGEDHSIFISFAPRKNPKIAMAVYVENAGYGATWAAPIASLMIEKYLTDSLSRPWLEEHVLKGDLIHNLNKKNEKKH